LCLAGGLFLSIALPGRAQDRSSQENKAVSRNPFFLNTILLGGSSEAKLLAARQAGFDQIELWTHDVERFDGGPNTIGTYVLSLGLGVTDYQVLSDFDGAPGNERADKRREA
jgi:4-hydroxyphenylpyruvate dioxygenase